MLKDNTIPVRQSYLEGTEIPEGTLAQVWVETGVIGGKQTRHSPSYPKIMNEGKSNQRNEFEQGLVDARSLYLKKKENGLQTDKDFKNCKITKKVDRRHVKYFPMLVRKFDDEKKNIIYPVYVQPKLDGCRALAYRKGDKVFLVSRNGLEKRNPLNHIKEVLLNILSPNGTEYIDGELYTHGLARGKLTGTSSLVLK